jgi:hypothetical protein
MALEDATNPMQGVSGPGKYAKRTDLEYQSQSYGDGVAYDAAKSGAPLASAPKSPLLSQAPRVSAGAGAAGVGLYDPSQRSSEDITTGVNVGPGAGSEALMMQSKFAERKLSDILAEMIPYDPTGEIQYLYQNALSRGQ